MTVSLEPRGATVARVVQALAAHGGDLTSAQIFAEHHFGAGSSAARILKAATSPTDLSSGITGAEWAAATSEFFELVKPATVFGRLAGARRVPFEREIPIETGAATAGWIGEANPKPIGELALDTTALQAKKAAGILVLSQELVRASGATGEALVRQSLVGAVRQIIDESTMDDVAADATRPAGLLNGVSGIAASGDSADDLAALVAAFDGNLEASYLVCHPTVAAGLALVRTTTGAALWPDVGVRGGSALGIPLITSRACPLDSSGGTIALVDASAIAYADGELTVSIARNASVQLDDGLSPSGVATVSLWQRNLIGARAEIALNWHVCRTGAVAAITGAAYGP